MTKRLLVTGSRNWDDKGLLIRGILDAWLELNFDPYTVLVHGACPTGADALADAYWTGNGLTVERHPAQWHRYRGGAGPIRNQEMVDLGADLCVAFLLPGSRGTADCVRRAEAAGITVRPITREG